MKVMVPSARFSASSPLELTTTLRVRVAVTSKGGAVCGPAPAHAARLAIIPKLRQAAARRRPTRTRLALLTCMVPPYG